jgi:hypothetical protein
VDREVEQFILILSTPRLMRLQLASEIIQVDATYKLNSMGYPTLVSSYSPKDLDQVNSVDI